MKLSDYMKAHDLSRAQFAEMIDVKQETVRRYLECGRVPTPKVMARIALATGCAVTANDFFGIAPAPSKVAAA
jgi:transcriptional regulator with XRE-family HTH domain